jgi:hypothetical protein
MYIANIQLLIAHEELIMTINETSKKWACSPAAVALYLRAGRVPGAFRRTQTAWEIPDGAKKPEPLKRGRKKQGAVK